MIFEGTKNKFFFGLGLTRAGLSVPDAEVLQKIADVLDVGVDELLGAEIKQENSKNEIAEQLARINEQMAVKNRRWGIFWKVVGIVLLIFIIWNVLGAILFSTVTSSGTVQECVEETVIE